MDIKYFTEKQTLENLTKIIIPYAFDNSIPKESKLILAREIIFSAIREMGYSREAVPLTSENLRVFTSTKTIERVCKYTNGKPALYEKLTTEFDITRP